MFKKNFKRCLRRVCSLFLGLAFLASSVLPAGISYAQVISPAILNLPVPGSMVTITSGFIPPLIKGLTIYPNNPLELNFIVDTGQSGIKIENPEFRTESRKLIKYFLAALTIPDENMWVNLSPYEKDRIISAGFGQTEMGRDLLAQDYLLKQLMASLTYPEDELGKSFWDKVYTKARELYGTTNIPINTFNKIWIVPDKAVVYEIGATAYVVKTHLKVMLEGDYLALKENLNNTKLGLDKLKNNEAKQLSDVSSAIVKEVLLPEIEKEVNEGKTFANLRQIYQSMVLATWYKKNLKESLLGQVYVNQNKIKGVDLDDKTAKEKIYQQYLDAFKKGVYSYIKEDIDPVTQKSIPRKYFSGGFQRTKDDVETGAKVETADQLAPEPRETFEQNVVHPLDESSHHDYAALVEVALVAPKDSESVTALSAAIEQGEQQVKIQKPLNGVPREIQNILDEVGIDIKNIVVQPGQENVQQVLDGILNRISEDKDDSKRKKVEDWLLGRFVMIVLGDEDILGKFDEVKVEAGQQLIIMGRIGGGAGDEEEILLRKISNIEAQMDELLRKFYGIDRPAVSRTDPSDRRAARSKYNNLKQQLSSLEQELNDLRQRSGRGSQQAQGGPGINSEWEQWARNGEIEQFEEIWDRRTPFQRQEIIDALERLNLRGENADKIIEMLKILKNYNVQDMQPRRIRVREPPNETVINRNKYNALKDQLQRRSSGSKQASDRSAGDGKSENKGGFSETTSGTGTTDQNFEQEINRLQSEIRSVEEQLSALRGNRLLDPRGLQTILLEETLKRLQQQLSDLRRQAGESSQQSQDEAARQQAETEGDRRQQAEAPRVRVTHFTEINKDSLQIKRLRDILQQVSIYPRTFSSNTKVQEILRKLRISDWSVAYDLEGKNYTWKNLITPSDIIYVYAREAGKNDERRGIYTIDANAILLRTPDGTLRIRFREEEGNITIENVTLVDADFGAIDEAMSRTQQAAEEAKKQAEAARQKAQMEEEARKKHAEAAERARQEELQRQEAEEAQRRQQEKFQRQQQAAEAARKQAEEKARTQQSQATTSTKEQLEREIAELEIKRTQAFQSAQESGNYEEYGNLQTVLARKQEELRQLEEVAQKQTAAESETARRKAQMEEDARQQAEAERGRQEELRRQQAQQAEVARKQAEEQAKAQEEAQKKSTQLKAIQIVLQDLFQRDFRGHPEEQRLWEELQEAWGIYQRMLTKGRQETSQNEIDDLEGKVTALRNDILNPLVFVVLKKIDRLLEEAKGALDAHKQVIGEETLSSQTLNGLINQLEERKTHITNTGGFLERTRKKKAANKTEEENIKMMYGVIIGYLETGNGEFTLEQFEQAIKDLRQEIETRRTAQANAEAKKRRQAEEQFNRDIKTEDYFAQQFRLLFTFRAKARYLSVDEVLEAVKELISNREAMNDRFKEFYFQYHPDRSQDKSELGIKKSTTESQNIGRGYNMIIREMQAVIRRMIDPFVGKDSPLDQRSKESLQLLARQVKTRGGRKEIKITNWQDVLDVYDAFPSIEELQAEVENRIKAEREGQTTLPFVDNAALTRVGGIDLNPKLLDLQIKRDGNGVPLSLFQQPIGSMNIQGFLPIIVGVSPVSIPLLLGFNNSDDPPSPSPQNSSQENLSYAQPPSRFSPKFSQQVSFLNRNNYY